MKGMLVGAFRFLPAGLWMALIYRASATPDLKSVPVMQRIGLLPAGLSPEAARWLELALRKSVHFGSYAVLSLLLAWALRASMERHRANWIALALTVSFAVSDEWHQSFVPGREGRWFDVLIDTAGGLLGLRGVNRAPRR